MSDFKRVGIYARVSTADQTTENQILDLRNLCQLRGWIIVAECVDNAMVGSKDDRPQLLEIMDLSKKRKIDILLVWRFDRFARSLSHLVNSLDELRQVGVDFVSYQENIDTSTPQGRMVFGVMGSLAEFELALIKDRIRAGLRRAATQGKTVGRPKLIVDTIRVHRLRQQGLSLRCIAKVLEVSKTTIERLLSPSQKHTQKLLAPPVEQKDKN